MKFNSKLRAFARSIPAKVSAGTASFVASAAALAQDSSPGAAIAGELSGGKADVMLVIAAAAVILGALILWGYVKRTR